ncbi:hypothetical protein CsatB_009506 [Cannabis sativa]
MATSTPDNEVPNASPIPKEVEKPPIEPIRLPTVEEIRGQDIWNNCAVRSVFSGVMGGALGLAMGLFIGSLDNPITRDEMSGKQQFVYQAKQMGRRSWSSAKAFAVMGFVFSAAECVIEKARAKHDTTNTVVAGCVTGGTISAKGNMFLFSDEVIAIYSKNLHIVYFFFPSILWFSSARVSNCLICFTDTIYSSK